MSAGGSSRAPVTGPQDVFGQDGCGAAGHAGKKLRPPCGGFVGRMTQTRSSARPGRARRRRQLSMQPRIVSFLTQFAEVGLFFAAAAVLVVGLLGLR